MKNSLNDILGQKRAVRLLKSVLDSGRVPPAFIFYGQDGVGKMTSAKRFAFSLSCQTKTGCGICEACKANEFGEGFRVIDISDYFENSAEKNKVSAFRKELNTHSHAHDLNYFVVSIDNSDLMNESMQASLLKSIEEPANGVCYILITKSIDALNATLRSRSVLVRFSPLNIDSLITLSEKILTRTLTYNEKELIKLAEGSISRALEILSMENSPLAWIDELLKSSSKRSHKWDRLSLQKKMEESMPAIISSRKKWKESLINFDRALSEKAYIPLALEVLKRRISSIR